MNVREKEKVKLNETPNQFDMITQSFRDFNP